MEQNFIEAKNLIEGSQTILLTMHERMDGDDGGSVLAMLEHLESFGKNVAATIKKGVPPSLKFLPGSHKIRDDITTFENFDLVITFGCSELKRTGSENIVSLSARGGSASGGKNSELKIINIDHHPDNQNFGTINLVDATKSSVAELVFDFFVFHNWLIGPSIATCLLTGIMADTGAFRHSNTQVSTLKAAAELLKKGAQVHKITKHTFRNKSVNALKAWGKALKNVFFDDKNKIIYSCINSEDLSGLANLPHNVFEGLVETLNTVPEARFAMFLKQDGEIIKGSLRSDLGKGVDVAQIARIFGGGGHKLAAGFSVVGKLEKDENGKWKVI